VDFLQVSNVYCKEDLADIKDLIRRKPQTKILVNIEHPDVLPELDKILSCCDGIVLARNWLANFIPDKFNMNVQKDIINLCKTRGKLIMVKGQILDSMLNMNTPSFVEMNDVVSLVGQACDCIILQRQTAIENVVLKCVEQLTKIIM
jgi:pyruvate kinase